MARLIDPERYKTTLQRLAEHLTESGKLEAAEVVKSLIKGLKIAPTVDAVEVVHGRWKKSEYHGFLCCSECKDVYIDKTWYGGGKWNYCPNCGADMREVI